MQVDGKTLEKAETSVLEHLATLLATPKLEITRYGLPPRPAHWAVRSIERRVDELEKELRRLQTAIENLAKVARDDTDAKPRSKYGSASAKSQPAKAKAVLVAAKDFWDAKMAMQEIGVLTFSEDLHLGSCWLLDAKRALAGTHEAEQAALLAHWKRMEGIYRKVRVLFDNGTKSGEPDKLAAATYYRAEAELWLVAAGGTVPNDRLP